MKNIDKIAMFLLIVGGINWGLWGVFDFNLVDYIFGRVWIDRVIYFFVGVAGVYLAISWKACCSRLGSKGR